jgi:hypothetical protein
VRYSSVVRPTASTAPSGRGADAHGLTRDVALVKSYVYDKYVRDGEFFVELAWWTESITGEIWLTGGATVRLPSKRRPAPQHGR